MNTFYIGCENIATQSEFSKFITICSLDELKEVYSYLERHSGKGFETEEDYQKRLEKISSFKAIIIERIATLNKHSTQATTGYKYFGPRRELYPKCLTEEGKKRFDLSIEKGFIDRDTREWKRNKTALGWWISDMKAVGGIVKKERNHWSHFEKYFGYEKVQHAFDNAKVNETCPDYDDIGPEVFPERYESNGTHKNDI